MSWKGEYDQPHDLYFGSPHHVSKLMSLWTVVRAFAQTAFGGIVRLAAFSTGQMNFWSSSPLEPSILAHSLCLGRTSGLS